MKRDKTYFPLNVKQPTTNQLINHNYTFKIIITWNGTSRVEILPRSWLWSSPRKILSIMSILSKLNSISDRVLSSVMYSPLDASLLNSSLPWLASCPLSSDCFWSWNISKQIHIQSCSIAMVIYISYVKF